MRYWDRAASRGAPGYTKRSARPEKEAQPAKVIGSVALTPKRRQAPFTPQIVLGFITTFRDSGIKVTGSNSAPERSTAGKGARERDGVNPCRRAPFWYFHDRR